MALTKSQISSLKRRAANNTLNVEPLIRVAMIGDASDIPILRKIKLDNDWSDTGWEGKTRVIPFGCWVDVICCYLEHGDVGLIKLARENQKLADFTISMLADFKTPQCVRTLLMIGEKVLKRPQADLHLALRLADAFNALLSFKDAVSIDEKTTAQIREFVHRLLKLELSEQQRSIGVCAIRGVGNQESIELLATLPPFVDCYVKLEVKAMRQIKARLAKPVG